MDGERGEFSEQLLERREQGVHLQLRSPLNRKPIIARNNECPHKSYCDIQNSCPNDYHACEYSSENLLGVV